MKKILYIGGFELPDKNAAAHRVMVNAKLLREMQYEVSFIGISKDIKNAPSVVNGFTSNPVPYPTCLKQWIHQIVTFVDMQQIWAYKPDYVIMYNFPSIASLRIFNACHKNGIRVIHDLTEWESATSVSVREFVHWIDINIRMRLAVKRMDGVIAISKLLYDYYRKYTKAILVPPTIDIDDDKWNRNSKINVGQHRRLIYAGSVGYGNKDRLDKIIAVVNSYYNIELDIIGLTKEQYIALFGSRILPKENIHFHGRVSHIVAIAAVQKSDFQILIRDSTLKNNAGFPTKFVESMACGTPLIATPISNITDYLVDGVNGYIVDENQPLDCIFDKILSMSNSDIVAMKEYCRNMRCFDYRQYKAEFEKLLC